MPPKLHLYLISVHTIHRQPVRADASGLSVRSLCTNVPGDGQGEPLHGLQLLPDTTIVQLIDLRNGFSKMTFGELRAVAEEAKASKGRDLIHVRAVRTTSLLFQSNTLNQT